PRSIWHNTDAQFLGFRIVRPLKVPGPVVMDRLWNCGNFSELENWNKKIRQKRREPIPRKD
ncbi:MAG: hypothetical protein P8J87_07465, partial [Verrucomicrobiales bacterium]|nr:hypothetical protein [Verrucomicrobiales bacterium]